MVPANGDLRSLPPHRPDPHLHVQIVSAPAGTSTGGTRDMASYIEGQKQSEQRSEVVASATMGALLGAVGIALAAAVVVGTVGAMGGIHSVSAGAATVAAN